MGTPQNYQKLPLQWHPQTVNNDCTWLEFIVNNSAPFSDWWTKTRIVQLAHSQPPNTKPTKVQGLPTYGAYGSETEIVEALRSTCPLEEYPAFAHQVNSVYVTKVLNSWGNQEFARAISRNFEVYVDRQHSNIFLVVSTAPPSLNLNRQLPPLDRFRPFFNIAEFGAMIRSEQFQHLTLRTHGYSTPATSFYQAFINEAESICLQGPINYVGTLTEKSAYIGYVWPSEQPIFAPQLWLDARRNWGIFFKFLAVIALLSWGIGTVLYVLSALGIVPLLSRFGLDPILDPLWAWLNWRNLGSLFWQWQAVAFVVFVLWLMLMQLLRLVVYQRDRYRAIHYGAPDLAEFFWRLDKALGENPYGSMPFGLGSDAPLALPSLKVNLVGHSMGCLLMVNLLRILSDRFGKDDRLEQLSSTNMGEYLQLNKLILSAPDIPLEFLREGRNNYVRSAILRCRDIYLFSSDRDVVLRYLSLLGNWFSEPSLEMSGLRLGNVYLKSLQKASEAPKYSLCIRVMLSSQGAVQPTSARDLFEKFNYLDCSEMPGINGAKLNLSPQTSLVIDGINSLLFFRKKLMSIAVITGLIRQVLKYCNV